MLKFNTPPKTKKYREALTIHLLYDYTYISKYNKYNNNKGAIYFFRKYPKNIKRLIQDD